MSRSQIIIQAKVSKESGLSKEIQADFVKNVTGLVLLSTQFLSAHLIPGKIISFTSSFRTALGWLSQQPVILFTHIIYTIWSIISKIVGYGWDGYYGRGRKVDSAASGKNLFQTQQDFFACRSRVRTC